MDERPFLDFGAGYVLRSLSNLPKQGTKQPWSLKQNYLIDLPTLKRSKVDDGVMAFSSPAAGKPAADTAAASAAA
jgi:hypothetical protein